MKTSSKEYTKLVLSIFVATVLAVGMTALVEHSSSASRDQTLTNPPFVNPVFVEIRTVYRKPEVYKLPSKSSLEDVFTSAGIRIPPGIKFGRKMDSGEVVFIDGKGRIAFGMMSGPKLVTLGIRIPLQDAGPEDIEAVPGIGKVLSRRIVDYIVDSEDIEHIDDLLAVKGVGKKTLERLRKYTRI